MNKKLDVAIIATVRPEVLQMTLQSFTKHLLNQFDCRAIINVDPAGDIENHSQMDVVNLCREYFNEVIYRTPETPSFAGAVQWVWQQVQTEFFFHLEDDWIIKQKIDKNELVQLFDDAQVAGATLNRRNRQDAYSVIARENKEVVFHNDLYMHYPAVSLNPSLFRTAYMQPIANRMNSNHDPEYQASKLTKEDSELILWRVTEQPILIDMGKFWRRANNIIKSNSDRKFSEWRVSKPKDKINVAVRILKWRIRKCILQIRYC